MSQLTTVTMIFVQETFVNMTIFNPLVGTVCLSCYRINLVIPESLSYCHDVETFALVTLYHFDKGRFKVLSLKKT